MLSIFIPDYIVRRKNDISLNLALEALTFFTCKGTTSELAIRPFLIDSPAEVMSRFYELAKHPHPHVRRWASEGCRPRLPWAIGLPEFKKDPNPILPILETLCKDDSKFVQKSVANNLNDIAKDHPSIVLAFAEKWRGTHPNTDWILKHGLRTLLKQGNPNALALFGATPVEISTPELKLNRATIGIGETQDFSFTGMIKGTLPQKLRIEYAVDFVKFNGTTSRKVFMISEGLPKHGEILIRKSHRFTDFTTRKHYAGDHQISVLVNGVEITSANFQLLG
nr:DNA alkylation repair protein [Sneathiella limimaris]